MNKTEAYTLSTIVKCLTSKIERVSRVPKDAINIRTFYEADYFEALKYLKAFKPLRSKMRCICYREGERDSNVLYAFELPKNEQ